MRAGAPSPWPLLLSKLRRARRAVVTGAELVAAGLEPEALLRAGVIDRADGARWRAPGCERHCRPILDLESRSTDGVVGVGCPHDPPCWEGWRWVPRGDMDEYACSAARVFAALRVENDLAPLDAEVSPPFVPVGMLRRRGRRIPVVWAMLPRDPFEEICRGLRSRLGGDGLFVLVSHTAGRPVASRLAGDVVVLDLGVTGDLGLWRGLDAIDPEYRSTRVGDPAAIFDDVVMEFATIPGERHVVRINGHDFGGFRTSDLKFLRLLYLAAARASDPDVENGGWLEKWRLQGDDKDHDVEKMRGELRRHDHPSLSPEERFALIKSSPKRDGTIRLAVHPRRIRFDDSLAAFAFLGDPATALTSRKRRTPGAKTLADNRRRGVAVAKKLLADARNLGVLPMPDIAMGE